MKNKETATSGKAATRAGVVSRFFLLSAALGFFIGLFEAYLLWTRPHFIPLLVPDVGYVIWFLAPLVDMTFFGLVGLGLGLLARVTRGREVLVAIEAGIVFTFVSLLVAWFHKLIGFSPFNFDAEVAFPIVLFASGFIVSLVLFTVAWRHVAHFVDRRTRVLVKPVTWGLAAVTLIAIVGIGVFVENPLFSPTPVHAAAPPPHAPNIVFITLDTVRADHLSSYGYSRPTTPNIDRFARTGVLFENAIAPTAWTLASHASLFTGLLPQQHGADWAVPLASGPWTLAEILRRRGYQTAGFTANFDYMQKGWGISQGFETYDDNSSCLRGNLAQTLLGYAVVQPIYQEFWKYRWFSRRNAQQINRSVYRWYHTHSDRPFFLFINYFDAHNTYVTSAPYEGRFGKASRDVIRRMNLAEQRRADSFDFSSTVRDSLIDSYDDCLAYLDSQVGDLFSHLRQSADWKNTIVIITADHGEEFGAHGSYDHGRNLYRGVLHVPLIIAGPGVPKDVRVKHIVGTRQIFSTILNLAGGGHTPFSRTSLARFWNPDFKPAPFDGDVVSELVPINDLSAHHAMISLTTSQWEYIEHRDGRQELYDWVADPQEQNNLAAAPADKATLQNLQTRLIGLVSDATGPWRGPEYLQALDGVVGPSRLSLLSPHPVQSGNPQSHFRIGMAQAYFKSQASAPARPSRSERDIIQSLPYQ